jgi:hypothetical protein
VAETGQPYAFTGDDPLNATDPLGLWKVYVLYNDQTHLPFYVGKTDRDIDTRTAEHSLETPKGVRFNEKEDSVAVLKTRDLSESESDDVEEYVMGYTGTNAGRGGFPMNQRHQISPSRDDYASRSQNAESILNEGGDSPGESAAWDQLKELRGAVLAAPDDGDQGLIDQQIRVNAFDPLVNFSGGVGGANVGGDGD